MHKSNIKKVEENNGEIDLTPMLDVVFIMLIFFIVTATFIKEPGIEVIRPDSVTSDKIKNQSILVAISSTNDIWINKTKIDSRTVKTVIERMHAENPKGAVVIQADNESTAEMFAIVADAAREAGVIDISLATSEQ